MKLLLIPIAKLRTWKLAITAGEHCHAHLCNPALHHSRFHSPSTVVFWHHATLSAQPRTSSWHGDHTSHSWHWLLSSDRSLVVRTILLRRDGIIKSETVLQWIAQTHLACLCAWELYPLCMLQFVHWCSLRILYEKMRSCCSLVCTVLTKCCGNRVRNLTGRKLCRVVLSCLYGRQFECANVPLFSGLSRHSPHEFLCTC